MGLAIPVALVDLVDLLQYYQLHHHLAVLEDLGDLVTLTYRQDLVVLVHLAIPGVLVDLVDLVVLVILTYRLGLVALVLLVILVALEGLVVLVVLELLTYRLGLEGLEDLEGQVLYYLLQ